MMIKNLFLKNYKIVLFVWSFIIFFVVFFLIFSILWFYDKKEQELVFEESYYLNNQNSLDQSQTWVNEENKPKLEIIDINTIKENNAKQDKIRYKKILIALKLKEKEKLQPKLNINYNLWLNEKDLLVWNKKQNIYDVVFSKHFSDKIWTIYLDLYAQKSRIRWNMKEQTIKIYNVKKMTPHENLSIFIHELGHYIDMNYLKNNIIWWSNDFYKLSWASTSTLYPGQDLKDFVSWYAMTNKYEDFAESFTYYVLFNDDFKLKAEKSVFLKEKYKYFETNLFEKKEFKNTNFSKNKIPQENWDTTKIAYFLQNFLDYLKK